MPTDGVSANGGQCDVCRCLGGDVAFDPVTRRKLCDRCWGLVDPATFGRAQPPGETILGSGR